MVHDRSRVGLQVGGEVVLRYSARQHRPPQLLASNVWLLTASGECSRAKKKLRGRRGEGDSDAILRTVVDTQETRYGLLDWRSPWTTTTTVLDQDGVATADGALAVGGAWPIYVLYGDPSGLSSAGPTRTGMTGRQADPLDGRIHRRASSLWTSSSAPDEYEYE